MSYFPAPAYSSYMPSYGSSYATAPAFSYLGAPSYYPTALPAFGGYSTTSYPSFGMPTYTIPSTLPPTAEVSKPLKMVYWELAGRAELIRLLAAVGGLKLEEAKSWEESGKEAIDYTSPGGLPGLQHGDLFMSQSGAIERYVASLVTKFDVMTKEQKAVDDMFMCIKEDVLAGCAKELFGDKDAAKIVAHLDKWMAVIESKAPATGFINGLPFPTGADLAILNLYIGFMPFGATCKIAGYDLSKWEKTAALVERIKATPEIAAYLSTNTTHSANPFGF